MNSLERKTSVCSNRSHTICVTGALKLRRRKVVGDKEITLAVLRISECCGEQRPSEIIQQTVSIKMLQKSDGAEFTVIGVMPTGQYLEACNRLFLQGKNRLEYRLNAPLRKSIAEQAEKITAIIRQHCKRVQAAPRGIWHVLPQSQTDGKSVLGHPRPICQI